MIMTLSSGRSRSASVSSASSSSSSVLQLDPSTLALLDSFLSTKAEEEERFNQLAEEAAARVAGLAVESEDDEKTMMSVDEYRLAFGEDWQLSQFWYSTAFATRLARSVYSLCNRDSLVAFISSPTAFVAFQHTNPLKKTRLLEYDQRFAVLAPSQFALYDLDEPDIFPAELKGAVDVVVCDPPFLNEITNVKVIKTLRQILHPTQGKLILLTSSSVEPILEKLYTEAPIGPLRRTAMVVEHGSGLANDFGCWGNWDGAETFGSEEEENSTLREDFDLYDVSK